MLLICELFVAPVKIISFFFFLMSHYFFYSAWTDETVTQNERNKPKKKERKKKKKRHCEVLKKYYCLCLQNWEEQIKKNIYENHKKK